MAAATQAKHRVPVRRSRFSTLRTLIGVSGLVGLGGAVGCTPTGSNEFPPGVQDPAVIKTPEGALAFYHGVLNGLGPLFEPVVAYAGIMTDELTATPMPIGVASGYTALDSRRLINTSIEAGEFLGGDRGIYGPGGIYGPLHRLRTQAREARGFVTTYLPDSTALAGHLYALEGYAVVLLADLYCSGVPLSTVDFGADYSMATGSTTDELYRRAEEFFVTALTSANGQEPVQQLASVGRGRALLALGRYAEAAVAVAAVPTTFRYEIVTANASSKSMLADWASSIDPINSRGVPSMGDREGGNGLDYRSSGDPRTPDSVLNATPDAFGNTVHFPAKYPAEGPTTYVLASGIEARLIEAEAALNANPNDLQWLAILNDLRQTAIAPALPALSDPGQDANGTDAPRVDLLFRERAFWLYLTAHRQGDLRRLIRQYHRSPTAVYPTGSYLGGNGQYGAEVTLPVPVEEQRFNTNYTGCINRNA